ncbi:ABC transporter substrate-binding protein [Nocardioides halotolerans]|uniref:ABC transporter substrate-binding protein n=1 Tax=Nocardioides halotolerans TaxID=433660 RepID=UPI00048B56B2|nr:ABC transporter substrate-binding protein [Nocardioides halotolerans]
MRAVAVVALAAIGLVACGDDGGGGGGSAGGSAAPGVDTKSKTVTVGAWRLASGPFASQNQTSQAVEACLKASNDAGGVNGWKFEFKANDTAGDPTRALQETRSLVEGKSVFALLWGPGSPSNQAVLPYVEKSGTPYHPGMSGDPFVGHFYDNIYPTIPPYSYQAMFLAKYAVETLGAERIGLLYQNDDVGQSSHDAMKDYVESLGAELVADVPQTGTDTDYTPMGNKLAEANPDAVIAWGYPTALVKGKAATMAAGVDVPWLGAYFNASDDVMKLDPATLDGTYFNYYLEPFFADTPEIKAYQDALKKYFPDVAPSGLPLNGYAACQVFLAGFEKMTEDGDAPTQDAYMKALDSLGSTQVGVIPQLEYTDKAHNGPTQSYVIQWKDGAWSVVQDAADMPTGAS